MFEVQALDPDPFIQTHGYEVPDPIPHKKIRTQNTFELRGGGGGGGVDFIPYNQLAVRRYLLSNDATDVIILLVVYVCNSDARPPSWVT